MDDVEELVFTLILTAACVLACVSVFITIPWVSDAFEAASFVMGVALFVMIVSHGGHSWGIEEAGGDERRV